PFDEKQAARDLYDAGKALQDQGKFKEALDKFERAQQIIPAPTNLLHFAECQVGLKQLVAASETYIAATKMPTNGNDAFTQAERLAASGRQEWKPRTPKGRISVAPKDAPSLSVKIDGRDVKAALINADVGLPLDPGTHQVVAVAPGFKTETQSIALRESED